VQLLLASVSEAGVSSPPGDEVDDTDGREQHSHVSHALVPIYVLVPLVPES
jgi:hypothetical protein